VSWSPENLTGHSEAQTPSPGPLRRWGRGYARRPRRGYPLRARGGYRRRWPGAAGRMWPGYLRRPRYLRWLHRGAVERLGPVPLRRLRRGGFAVLLAAVTLVPGPVSAARPCTGRACLSAGQVRWTRPLPGSWVADPGPEGTVPAQGSAYVAMNHGVAAVGLGLTVYGYASRTGASLWAAALPGFPAGSRLISVRVWPGVVTAGVDVPGAQPGAAPSRREVVLSEATGRVIRSYPAAPYGGAVSASRRNTVIVGTTAVTSYSNRTGAVAWRRPTGPDAQAWQRDGNVLYLAEAAGGYLSGAPVRELRRISLRTGAQRILRPQGPSFRGELDRALDGVVVFADASGTVGYSGRTGARLWRRDGTVPVLSDAAEELLYLSDGAVLAAVDPWTGRAQAHVPGGSTAGTSAFYAARNGVVLGLDPGGQGDAWGYDAAAGRVLWTNAAVPWPHYFVDLSGIGGSADPASGGVLLAGCGRTGPGQRCARPQLTALNW
jgi:hypothetical protein